MTPVITVVTYLWRAAIPAAVLLITGGGPSGIVFLLLLPVVAIGGLLAWLSWRRFTYSVRDGALVVESGVLNRTRREVPLGRIQQVDVRRDLVQRFFGLSALHVDTASSGSGAEVVLASLDESEAIAVHQLLLDHRHGRTATTATATAPTAPLDGGPLLLGAAGTQPPGVHPAPGLGTPSGDPDGQPVGAQPYAGPSAYRPGFGVQLGPDAQLLTRVGTKDLVISALTGRGLSVGIAAVAALLGAFGETAFAGRDVGSGLAAVFVVGVFVAIGVGTALAAAVITMILANNDFALHRVGTDLHVRRGLLEQRQTTLALHRVQCVRIVENPLRRRLGLCSVELQSAGSGGSAGGNEQAGLDTARLTIPLLRTAELFTLLDAVLPFDGPLPPIEPAPPIARRRRINRVAIAVVCGLAVAAPVFVASGVWWPLVATVLVAVGGGVWAEMAYRALGSGLGDDVVVARAGGYLRETSIVPMARLQSVSLERSLFQVRSGIGTLRLDVAGQGNAPQIIDVDQDRLVVIRAAALFDDTTRADERRARDRTRRAARSETADVTG